MCTVRLGPLTTCDTGGAPGADAGRGAAGAGAGGGAGGGGGPPRRGGLRPGVLPSALLNAFPFVCPLCHGMHSMLWPCHGEPAAPSNARTLLLAKDMSPGQECCRLAAGQSATEQVRLLVTCLLKATIASADVAIRCWCRRCSTWQQRGLAWRPWCVSTMSGAFLLLTRLLYRMQAERQEFELLHHL
jgi:hypothetical protein